MRRTGYDVGEYLYLAEPNHDWLLEQMNLKKKILLMLFYMSFKIKNFKKIKLWPLNPNSSQYYTAEHKHVDINDLKNEITKYGFKIIGSNTQEVLLPLGEGVLFHDAWLDRLMYALVRFLDRIFFPSDCGRGLQLTIVAKKE